MWPAGNVVVLGAGGAAKAVALKLASSGAERVWVCNRTLAKAEGLCTLPNMTAAGFDTDTLKALCAQADLVVNGTNLGMEGQGQFPDFGFLDALPADAGVFDAIYHPAETQLLKQSKERGLKACNGLPMLIHQAIFALEYFLDRPLDHERMGEVIQSVL
jgi:shikimate dehydrogenase